MSVEYSFTKEELDNCLKAVAKQFRKLNGKAMPAEITLIGGASIIINYGFRNSTSDVDALIHAASSMKDAISYVADQMALPNGWLNEDFRKTTSYTPRLVNYTKYYRTFSNIVTVRTITGEYLVAMKLKSFRQYKHDISDIVGILWDQEKNGDPLTFARIDKAIMDLYDGWSAFSPDARMLIEKLLASGDYATLYQSYMKEETNARATLLSFDKNYPNVLKEDNLNSILQQLRKKESEK